MASSSDSPLILIPGSLGLTRSREEEMCRFIIDRLKLYRKQMGYDSEKSYTSDSWLWKRHIATRMYENDFSWRVREGNLFAKVNMTLNMTEQFITHHHARMSDDLVPDDEFFGVGPEGIEDKDPVLQEVQRLAHHRAKRQKLQGRMKNGLLGTLIRGESVCKVTQVNRRIQVPMKARLVIQDGQPVRTSLNEFVHEMDEWMDDPESPDTALRLKKDPNIRRRKEGQLQFSANPKTFHKTTLERAAEMEWMHFADFVAPLNVKCLEDAELTGHFFEKSVFDLLDTLPEELMSPTLKQEYLQKRREALKEKNGSEAGKNKEWTGENEEHEFDPHAQAYKTGNYAEVFVRYSPYRNGRFERIYMLIDLDLEWPIHYTYVHDILTWTDRPHPYQVTRVFPSEERWYGQGYYQRFYDNTLFADKCWNRIELELQKSGNLLFENPNATEEGKAGLPIRFRDTGTRRLVGDFTADDALTVKTVEPQVEQINTMLDAILQRLQSSVGMTSANDPALQNMPAADTLGGMEMLQETSNVQLRKREDEAGEGLNESVQAWGEADLKMVELKDLAFMGPDIAPLVMEWLTSHRDEIRDHIEIKTETIRKAKLLQENTQVLTILKEWISVPPLYKEAYREEYAHRLRLIGVKDPGRLLINPEMEAMQEGATPAGAAAMVAGQPDPEQPAPAKAA